MQRIAEKKPGYLLFLHGLKEILITMLCVSLVIPLTIKAMIEAI